MGPSLIRKLSLKAARLGGAHLLLRRSSQGPTALFYHGIEEKLIDADVQTLHLPLRIFEQHIKFLRRHREIISLDYLEDCLTHGYPLNSRQVVLTFDDGYKNNLRVLAPYLKTWNVPFGLFISTRHVLEGRRFPGYYLRAAVLYTERPFIQLSCMQERFPTGSREQKLCALQAITRAMKIAPQELADRIVAECRVLLSPDRWAELDTRFTSDEPMDWQDVIRIQSMGATIGSHCHYHCILHANQSRDEIVEQLRESKRVIEKQFGECKFMAYPNGTTHDISTAAYEQAQAERYRICFTTVEGEITAQSDPYFAPRLFAQPDFEEFCYSLSRSGDLNQGYYAARRAFAAISAESTECPKV